jgi:hypothetical protein
MVDGATPSAGGWLAAMPETLILLRWRISIRTWPRDDFRTTLCQFRLHLSRNFCGFRIWLCFVAGSKGTGAKRVATC